MPGHICDSGTATPASVTLSGEAGPAHASVSLSHSLTPDVNALAADNVLSWDTQTAINTAAFAHSTETNSSRLTVIRGGVYLPQLSVRTVGSPASGVRYQGNVRLRKNGSTDVTTRAVGGYARFSSGCSYCGFDPNWPAIQLMAGDYIEAVIDRQSTRTDSMVLAGASFGLIRL